MACKWILTWVNTLYHFYQTLINNVLCFHLTCSYLVEHSMTHGRIKTPHTHTLVLKNPSESRPHTLPTSTCHLA